MHPLRKKLLWARILVPLAAVIAVVLWYWHPWQPRIVIHEHINPRDGATMVWVPAGFFRMGSSTGEEYKDAALRHNLEDLRQALNHESRSSDAVPSHIVYLDGYWIYKHEVTVAKYRQFCQATGRQLPKKPDWGWQDNFPITDVSWDDASAYAIWAGASLPTEAQWEKAARGTDGRLYPWGNIWNRKKCSNWIGSITSAGHPSPVGSYPAGASPYGALDMAGNVKEWCEDWYDEGYYNNAPSRNPTGPAKGDKRVVRGGSWVSLSTHWFRTNDRDCGNPAGHRLETIIIGFRCVVRSPKP